jgi:hypothetical protein
MVMTMLAVEGDAAAAAVVAVVDDEPPTSFETVLQRCWQSFSPGLNFTNSFFPLNYHIQTVTAIYLLSLAKFHPVR